MNLLGRLQGDAKSPDVALLPQGSNIGENSPVQRAPLGTVLLFSLCFLVKIVGLLFEKIAVVGDSGDLKLPL
jgi:hypothetical protein